MFDFCDRSYGSNTSVKQFGAQGGGVTDDTLAFQAAIDSLPDTGGTIFVPGGNYPINMVKLRSRVKLRLAPDAVLQRAEVPLAPKAYLLYLYRINDVTIEGGVIDGRRLANYPTTDATGKTSTFEWNHGIQVRLCQRVTIRDIAINNCGGDGICIGGESGKLSDDILCLRVRADNNRRNNITVGGTSNTKLVDCVLTKANGTSPECGVDIEPDKPGTNTNTLLESCTITDNKKWGVNVFTGSGNVTIRNCAIRRNNRGIDIGNALNVSVKGCEVSGQVSEGIVIHNNATNVVVGGDGTEANQLFNNYMKQQHAPRAEFTMVGTSSKTSRDILIQQPTSNVQVLVNNYK